MELNLAGRTALITGASQGIGYAIAKVLAAEGCHLHLAARNGAAMGELKKELAALELQHKTLEESFSTAKSRVEVLSAHVARHEVDARSLTARNTELETALTQGTVRGSC